MDCSSGCSHQLQQQQQQQWHLHSGLRFPTAILPYFV
jgi:hypothetical protein